MAQPDHNSSTLDFSNAVLKAWLLYAHNDPALYERLLSELNVENSWIENEVQWHSVEFHEKFLEEFARLYGPDAAIIATKAMFAQQGFRLGQSALGLLLTPKVFLSQLPRMAKRMNHYSSFSFSFTGSSLTRSWGVLKQDYNDRNRHGLNMHLCECCRASTEGVFRTLGYTLLAMTETSCVNRGDAHCEYHVEWVNRFSLWPLVLATGPLFAFLAAAVMGQLPWFLRHPLAGEITFGMILACAPLAYIFAHHLSRARLNEAFEYQQETLERLRQSLDMQQKLNLGLVEYQSQYEKTLALAQIGELSYGIIHDMASPISLIRLGYDLLDRKIEKSPTAQATPEDFHKSFNLIRKSTDRLLSLQNLLRRFVAQNEQSQWIEIDVPQVAHDTAHFYAVAADKAGISLDISIDPELKALKIRAKESYVERAIINLLNNSVSVLRNHTHRKLVVSLRRSSSAELVLAVEDSGPGIPPERLGRLFEKFGHSSASSARVKEGELRGTGWGLYSIHAMMSEMGGNFKVESSPAGTKAMLIFPASLIVTAPSSASPPTTDSTTTAA